MAKKRTTKKQSDGESGAKTVTLGFADYRYNSWDFGISGVDEIRAEGTDVPADKEEEVREAAKKRGVELKKM